MGETMKKYPNDLLSKVAVITPTRGRDSLKNCIESVGNQSYEGEIRHYIVTDGIDGTPIQEKFGDEVFAIFVRAERGGPSAARNSILQGCWSPGSIHYVAFLDDDDTYRPDAISLLVSSILAQDDVDVVYGDLNFKQWKMKDGEKHLDEERVLWSEDWGGYGSLKEANYIPLPACLFHLNFFKKYGIFREDIGRCVDWELLARGEANGAKFRHIPYVIGEANWVWGKGSDNISTSADPSQNFPPTSWARIHTLVKGHYI